MSSNGGMRI